MLFNIRHAECQDEGEGTFVQAPSAKAALQIADPVFRYYAGDADSWSGIESSHKRLKPVAGFRPADTCPGTEPYMASADDTPDYYLVYQVAALPAGATLKTPKKTIQGV